MSQEDIQKWMTESSESLAKEYYSMSPDRVAEFNLNPGEVLPKMLADVHMTVLTSVTQAIVHQLPSLMQTVYETSQSVSEGEKMFYDAWPTLKERKNQVHADAVRLAVDYRARNPNATPEQVIRDVGAMVHMQHRIPVPDMLGGAQGETPSVAPYQPAQGGGVPTSTPRAPTNQIDQLVQEFLVEDA